MADQRVFRALSLPEFIRSLRADLASHDGDWTRPGFHTLVVHRLGKVEIRTRVGRAILRRVTKALGIVVRNCYGIEVGASCHLGTAIEFRSTTAVVIHDNAVVGDGCVFHQRVTIGAVSDALHRIAPTIGDGVTLRAGAVVVGAVHVGDGARIGPNTVVMADVPDGATVWAPPPTILPPSGSTDAHRIVRPAAFR